MKKNSLKVALNMSTLPVPEKINKALTIVGDITANQTTFATPNPSMASVSTAITDLQTAWNNAQDGGKSLTAIMHDKEGDLMKLMNDLAHYVEGIANYDESIIHLAGMDVKKKTVIPTVTFDAKPTQNPGEIKARVKYIRNTFYKWQYSNDGITWIDFKTTSTSRVIINGLTSATKYFIRMALIDVNGEHDFNTPITCVAL